MQDKIGNNNRQTYKYTPVNVSPAINERGKAHESFTWDWKGCCSFYVFQKN